MPKNVAVKKQNIDTFEAERIIPEQAVESKILLYIHDGGFISGSSQIHRMHFAKFALGCKLKSIVFNFRLAPEHPCPAALHDCVVVYNWLLEEGYDSHYIIAGGESAGSTLTLFCY